MNLYTVKTHLVCTRLPDGVGGKQNWRVIEKTGNGGDSEPKEETIAMIVSRNLKALRGGRFSQYTLAEAAGIPRSTIQQIEDARYRKVDIETLKKLSGALGVTVNELLEPRGLSMSSAAALAILMESPWAASVQPTREEQQWIRMLPDMTWYGVEPSPEIVAGILLAWRQTRPR